MRILYVPQLSMRNYATGEWQVDEDSQATKMREWMKALPSDWEWTWCVPLPSQRKAGAVPRDHSWFSLKWAPNVLLDRYFFDPDFQLFVKADRYDVAIVEAVEKVPAVKAAAKFHGWDLPCIGMIGLYDDRDDAFYIQQLAGVTAADHVFFPLDSVRDSWIRRVQRIAPRWAFSHTSVVPAIYGTGRVYTRNRQYDRDRPVINFISRLSDGGRTRYGEFFAAVNLLHDRGLDFEVWVQNPNDAMTRKEVFEQSKAITCVGNHGHDDYLQQLVSSDIVPILYDVEGSYSVGLCEAIDTGNVIVSPTDIGGVKVWQPYDAESIAMALTNAISSPPAFQVHMKERQADWLIENRSVGRHIALAKQTIEEVAK